jgi:HD-GYP domain-containing protein (c-di-GMP phosphodiesterase class II)
MEQDVPAGGDEVRTAEVIAALSLPTDLFLGVPLEHGLHSTLVAMGICDKMGVDAETAQQAYYLCLLFYVGCTATVDISTRIFDDVDGITKYATPSRFASRAGWTAGVIRAIAPPGGTPTVRALQFARGFPRALRAFPTVVAASCEVARMLTDRLGLPPAVSSLFAYEGERWDGRGEPGAVGGDAIPLPVRIAHVARDAVFQSMLGDVEFVGQVIRRRSGGAFDPEIAAVLAEDVAGSLALDPGEPVWEATLASEPRPWLTLRGEAIDEALGAMGAFSDLISPYVVGHSAGVAELVEAAARRTQADPAEIVRLRRAALVHDLGRVAVPVGVWDEESTLTADAWEQVRLHAYHTERFLTRSPFLAGLAHLAGHHHERLDGSGYHRGATAAALGASERLLAAADAYHAMTEPRSHRPALSPDDAAAALTAEAREGRLGADAVTAVLGAAGQRIPRLERPAGLSERETQVVKLLARGRQTKQVARELGISRKTADRHIQNAYRKMGVSTRAGAALFAMSHGLMTWGELPMGGVEPPP